jgi:hypothetical protein
MSDSLQRVIYVLRRAGLTEIAAEAQRTLSDPVDPAELDRFCAAHALSKQSLMDRLGGSP